MTNTSIAYALALLCAAVVAWWLHIQHKYRNK